jgi:ketosteroid isomerase-like protein
MSTTPAGPTIVPLHAPSDAGAQRDVAVAYFRKADARDPTVVDLFTEDVELFFPKLGRVRGKDGFARFAGTLAAEMARLEHDVEGFRVVQSGSIVVVEGTERGETRDGTAWPDGVVSEGRFCNVFEFDGTLIRRLYVYVDPDFTSRDRQRILELRGAAATRQPSATGAGLSVGASEGVNAPVPSRPPHDS